MTHVYLRVSECVYLTVGGDGGGVVVFIVRSLQNMAGDMQKVYPPPEGGGSVQSFPWSELSHSHKYQEGGEDAGPSRGE